MHSWDGGCGPSPSGRVLINTCLLISARVFSFAALITVSAWWTDLPVSVLGQGAQRLRAPLDGAGGGCRVAGQARGEPACTARNKSKSQKEIIASTGKFRKEAGLKTIRGF